MRVMVVASCRLLALAAERMQAATWPERVGIAESNAPRLRSAEVSVCLTGSVRPGHSWHTPD